MHSRLRIKKENRAGAWDMYGGGGGGAGGSPILRRSDSRARDPNTDAPLAPSPTKGVAGGWGLAEGWRLGRLALLRALALLRPAAAVLELLARALRLIASAVVTRGRSQRQRELLQWLHRGDAEVPELGALWRNGQPLCAAVNAAVPGACPAVGSSTCDFAHAQQVASKYLGVAPMFSEAEVQRAATGAEVPPVRRLERYLRAVRRAANRLQFAAHNPAVAWTLPSSFPSSPEAPIAATADDDESPEGETAAARSWTRHRARGTGLVAAIRGRRALFTVFLPSQYTQDLRIQIRGPNGDIGQKVIRAPTFQPGSKARHENDGSANATRASRRVTFSLKPWFSAGESRHQDAIPVETREASGSVKVCYVPRSAGLHQVSLLSHGRHIADSPYNVMVDVRAGAAEAPDFTEPWWAEAERGSRGALRSSARRVRIVYRVVDFVTEKMLLTNDGKLQKIPPDAPPPLLRALSLPDLYRRTPTHSIAEESDSSDSDSDTFYDSQSEACASSLAPSPSLSQSSQSDSQPKPKRDPEFFRKQYRKVLLMCRFLTHNKPNRRGLEILSTAGRLLDGRPVLLPPEFHTLLAKILAESINKNQRIEVRAENVMSGEEPTSSTHVGLNSISDLVEPADDDHTRMKRIRSESRSDVATQPKCNDPVPDTGSVLEDSSLDPHPPYDVLPEFNYKLDDVHDNDESITSLQVTLETTSDVRPTNEKDSSHKLHILSVYSPHNSKSEEIIQGTDHPWNQELNILCKRENNLVECFDNLSNELELPFRQLSEEQIINTETEIDPNVSNLQRNPASTQLLSERGDVNPNETRRPDSGINLSQTVTQSGMKRPNVLELSSTFQPHHLSDSARVSFDGLKNRPTEEEKKEAHKAKHQLPTSNIEKESEYEWNTKVQSIQTSTETTIENNSMQENGETTISKEMKPIQRSENDRDELNKTLSEAFQGGTDISQILPEDTPEPMQYGSSNELDLQEGNETNFVTNLPDECSDHHSFEIKIDKFDEHIQFPGRPPEDSSSSSELESNQNDDDLPSKKNVTESGSEAGDKLDVKERQERSRPPAPPTSPPPPPPPIRSLLVPRGEPPREPAPLPPIPRDVPQRSPRDIGAALDRPPPNLDAVLSAASLEEALARFEHELQEADPAHGSPQGGPFGSSNGTSSCRSWDKGDSDYVSMEDVQSSLHHSPDGGLPGGEDLAEDWMRFLTVDYDPDRLGPAEEEIWSSIARAQDSPNDHPVSDWVSNLMPSNRYHPRVLSPGIHPMTSIKEESEDRSSPASPTSPVPSPFKLLETQRSLHNSSPFLSVTSPSPDNMSQKGEEQFDSFEWRPQVMTPDDQVVVGSLIDFDNTAALKTDVDSSNKSLCSEENKPANPSPEGDLLNFLLPCSKGSEDTENISNETDIEYKTPPQQIQRNLKGNLEECVDKVNSTKTYEISGKKASEKNASKIVDIDIEAWKTAIDEYLAPSSLGSWESLRHTEHFDSPSNEEYATPNETSSDRLPSTGGDVDNVFRDDWDQRATNESSSSPPIDFREHGSSIQRVDENRMNIDKQCEKSCCSTGLMPILSDNQVTTSINVPHIFIEDIDLLLTPCVSPQLHSSFDDIEDDEEKDKDDSVMELPREEDERNTLLPMNSSNIETVNQAYFRTQEIGENIPETQRIPKLEAEIEKIHSEKAPLGRELNFDSNNSEPQEKSNISEVTAKSQRLESKFRDATKESCSISQWPVESSADIVPSPIRVTQWKQFWDQKAAAQKRKDDFKTSGVQRTIKRGSTHLEYLKCCHSPASPQLKRQHPSIRIPGIVSKWRKSFENVVDANKVAREFMKLRGVKKRKSILPSYNAEQEQTPLVNDTKPVTNSPKTEVPEKDNTEESTSIMALKVTKEKSEWPESNLVTSRKKKFEIREPVSQERRSEYFKTIPPRNKVTKVAEYRKFWDSLSKGQSCEDLNRDVRNSDLIITGEIMIDEIPSLEVNTSSELTSEPKTKETQSIISYDNSTDGEENLMNGKSRSMIELENIAKCSTSKLEVSRENENTFNNMENVSQSPHSNGFDGKILSQHTSQDEATTLEEDCGEEHPEPTSSPQSLREEQPPPPVTPRRLHIVSAEEIWYRARRIPIEEVEGLSSGSDDPSRSLDESDQSWSIVEEGAESQPDSLTDACSHHSVPPPLPPPPTTTTSLRANRNRAAAAATNRSNREARSRFENAKLFFHNLELGVSSPSGMGLGRRSSHRGRRLRGGTDIDTSTDDTGSEGGGSVRLARTRRRCGAIQARASGGAQSDTETLLSRVRVPRGLFRDVRSGGVPQSRELLAALAAVDSRPASPYEEVAAATGGGGGDEVLGVALAPSPSPPASPAPRSPLPHAYDAEYPYLPATDPRHFRPRSQLKSFALGGVHIPAFQDHTSD